MKKKPLLEIFLPRGVVWQIWEDAIQTVSGGRVIMPKRKCGGDWREWLTVARNVCNPVWLYGAQPK